MKLIIGNKNYSSWSLRPWLLLRHAGIPFEEVKLSFSSPTFKQEALRYSPVGKVPVLSDATPEGEIVVWDSLAIAEYVAEKYPDQQLWPAGRAARAHARAICAEMHSGFQSLRNYLSMNVTAPLAGRGWNVEVQRDIDRITTMWIELRQRHAKVGPFLFGNFSVADAYYTSVVTRFNTYAPELPSGVREYMQTILNLPAMKEWFADAAQENDFVDFDEPYRMPAA